VTQLIEKDINNKDLTDSKETALAVIVFISMLLVHIGTLLVFNVGISKIAFSIFLVSYFLKAIGITMGFHRYFAHRSFKTSRGFQFILALLGSNAIQGGVFWWSSHHRGHHIHSDKEEDLHSPVTHSFFHSHLAWMWDKTCFQRAKYRLNDFKKFKELKLLNKYYVVVVLFQITALYTLGEYFRMNFVELNTTGPQLVTWGFFVATVWTWHITFSINSICHVFGKKRYQSNDESRNNWIMAILAFGEGWHNNHHKYGWSARNGFRKREVDLTWYLLVLLEKINIVWDLKTPTEKQLKSDLV
jgi:stearoyl-CoA desaturase (delta-9 desaturase)